MPRQKLKKRLVRGIRSLVTSNMCLRALSQLRGGAIYWLMERWPVWLVLLSGGLSRLAAQMSSASRS